jgi:Zn-dependent peptidase ImmA (M78 family)/DNA-binding XRE family transcriptional regulator
MSNERIFYAHKLKLARNFHGLSLEEVGDQVAATRQYIQQLESSAKQPSGGMVAALADTLSLDEEFFYVPDLALSSEEECHFRSRQAKTVALKCQALSQATLLEKLVDELDDMLEFPAINIPSIPVNDLSEIEGIAERVRLEWKLGTSGPIKNVVRAAENAGIVVSYFKGISEKIDAFSKHGYRPIVIRNPLKESVCRMRFDIAHECGHLIMHQGKTTGDKQTETEANGFASAFLLPRAAFVSEFPRMGGRFDWSALYEMKLRWKVSVAAIIRRAFDLGIIDAAAYRRASIHLSKTGQAKKEHYDDSGFIQQEEPELLNQAIAELEEHAPHMIVSLSGRMMVKGVIIEQLIGRPIKSGIEAKGNVVPIKR